MDDTDYNTYLDNREAARKACEEASGRIFDEPVSVHVAMTRSEHTFCVTARTALPAALDEIDRLRGALEEIADRYHSGTCSCVLVRGTKCSCHVGIARRALEGSTDGE